MLEAFSAPFDNINAFLLAGGNVLVVIMITTFVMWMLVVERLIFFLRLIAAHKIVDVNSAWGAVRDGVFRGEDGGPWDGFDEEDFGSLVPMEA